MIARYLVSVAIVAIYLVIAGIAGTYLVIGDPYPRPDQRCLATMGK